MGKIYKLDGKFQLPQIIIEDSLVINYQQLQTLNESGLLDKLVHFSQCEHIRFYKNTVAYAKTADDLCIYCYSKKKTTKQVTIFCNFRDCSDEDNNDIINFCETNELKFELIDTVNNKSSLVKEKTIIFNGKYDEPYRFEDFRTKVEHIIYNRVKCEDCGKKLSSVENTVERCVSCFTPSLSSNSSSSFLTNTPLTEKRPKRNPYNFIEKLQLYQRVFSGPQNQVKKLLDYSFKSEEEFI
jgi:hypothetical protein